MRKKATLEYLSVTGKLISPSGIPDTESQITNKTPKDNTDKPLRNLYEGTSNFRFRDNIEDNPFHQSGESHIPILFIFLMWKSTDNIYYYNILKNKDKGPAKRKVTFGQTFTPQLSNMLSKKQPGYWTRYQIRANNSPEESPDDNDNDNDDDDDNNQGNNLQIVNLINPLHHLHIKIWMTGIKAIISLIEDRII